MRCRGALPCGVCKFVGVLLCEGQGCASVGGMGFGWVACRNNLLSSTLCNTHISAEKEMMYKWITNFVTIAIFALLVFAGQASAGPNANAILSLDLILNGEVGNQIDNGITSGNVSGRGTKIAIEVFAKSVTASLVGVKIEFEFDASVLTFDKAENSAFAFVIPEVAGTNFASVTPVTLSSSGFLARAEFTTAVDVTDREFSLGIKQVTLAESAVVQDEITTPDVIKFNAALSPDFDGDGMVGFADFVQFAGVFGSSRGDGTYQTKYDLDSDGAIGFSDFVIFTNDFGTSAPASGGGGGGGGGDSAPKMYWTKAGTYHIQSANLDGSNVEDVVNTGLEVFGLNGIALNVAGGKIYWASWYEAKIQRANLDGSNIEDLVTGLRTPNGIALDMRRGKIYWTATYAHKIQRSDLDGSNVEDLITGLAGPNGIVLDVIGDKMYWTSAAYNKIRRANLDGSNIEDLVTGLSYPRGIALDVIGGKMYWTNAGSTDKIQRSDLDGSNVEDLVTAGLSGPTLFSGPNGIALDVDEGKMYWTSRGKDKIQRSDLDGSNVEDLVTGLRSLGGIALGISGGGSGGNGGGEGGGGGRPDLIVESPSVSDNSLNAGQSFTLRATVRNQGTGRAATTTLRYYRSSNATITTGDREVGTDPVSGLAASGTSAESIRLNIPSSAGTYFYGACVDNVSGESDTGNNCSTGVRITVTVVDDHGNTRSGATRVSLGSTTSGRLSAGDTDYFRVSVSGSGTLVAYTTGSTDTYGAILNSSGGVLTEDDDAGVGSNFYISASVRSGTYYIRIRGYDSSTTGNYTLRIEANQEPTSGTSGDFNIELVFVNDNDFTSSQKTVFRQVARHWMSIITEDLRDIDFSTNPYNEWDADLGARIRVNDTVDDLRIFVRATSIDGSGDTVGKGGSFWIRGDTRLPILGKILLDTADLQRMDEEGSLWTVILHEMGHVLGIGTLWEDLDLLRGSSNRYFIGPLSIQAFNNAGGRNYNGAKVPTESDGGHWRESVLGTELMTPTHNYDANPLSAITIQSLADLGYRVDVSQADVYSLPVPISGKLVGGRGRDWGDCSLKGPIYVSDENGRIIDILRE